MGFAEEQFLKYLRKNISDLENLELVEMLMYLPCLTTATQERLRQQVMLNGNQNTVWNFINDLRKRSNWVEEFIEALRKCDHGTLAQRYQEEYSRFLLPRSPQAPQVSQPANHQPPVSPANYHQQPHLDPRNSPNTSNIQPESNRSPPSYSEVLKSNIRVQTSTLSQELPRSFLQTQPGLHHPFPSLEPSGQPMSPEDVVQVEIYDEAKLPIPETSPAQSTSQKNVSNSSNEVSEELHQNSNDHRDNVLASGQISLNPMTYHEGSTTMTRPSTSRDGHHDNSTSQAQQPKIQQANNPITHLGLPMPPAHTLMTSSESSLTSTQPTPREMTTTFPPAPPLITHYKSKGSSPPLLTHITQPHQSHTSNQSPPNQTTHTNHKPDVTQLPPTQTTFPNQKHTGTPPSTTQTTHPKQSHAIVQPSTTHLNYLDPKQTSTSSTAQIIHTDPKQTSTQPSTAQIIHTDPKETGTQPSTAQIIHNDPKQASTQPSTAQIIHAVPKQTGTQPSTAQIIHTDPKETGTQPSTAQIIHTDPKQTGTQPSTAQIIHTDPKQTGTQPSTAQIIHTDPKQTGTQPSTAQIIHADPKQTGTQPSTAQIIHTDPKETGTQPSTAQIIHTDPKETGTQPSSNQKTHLEPSQASTQLPPELNIHGENSRAATQPQPSPSAYPRNSLNNATRESNILRVGPQGTRVAVIASVRPMQGNESEDENDLSKPGVLRSTVDNVRLEADDPDGLSLVNDSLKISESMVPGENRPLNSNVDRRTGELSSPRGPGHKDGSQAVNAAVVDDPDGARPEDAELLFNNSPGHRTEYAGPLGPYGSQQPEESSFYDTRSITVNIREEPTVDLTSGNLIPRRRHSGGQLVEENRADSETWKSTKARKENNNNNNNNNLLLTGLLAAVISAALIVLWRKRNSV
ncbi:mitochondrial antiviral-signaling protein [Spea bombifrons]|uniref:mitochondrial antiviral-signaling protein n=1 Tax=Spea bombifrons TaxID=233779 RepID=UPI00234BAA61|nr:mitochondrial antiviral-signaling protein [Spea bombifrons]